MAVYAHATCDYRAACLLFDLISPERGCWSVANSSDAALELFVAVGLAGDGGEVSFALSSGPTLTGCEGS